jgi:hypothetical protein
MKSPDEVVGAAAADAAVSVDGADPSTETPFDEGSPSGVALGDAYQIAERIADDEVAAEVARRHYRESGLPDMAPDQTVNPLLRPGEKLVAMRPQALLDVFDGVRVGPVGGRLYLTSQRLVHAGAWETRQIELSAIDEVGPSGERLLITLRNGVGWALQLDGPRVLRVAMAELLAAAR